MIPNRKTSLTAFFDLLSTWPKKKNWKKKTNTKNKNKLEDFAHPCICAWGPDSIKIIVHCTPRPTLSRSLFTSLLQTLCFSFLFLLILCLWGSLLSGAITLWHVVHTISILQNWMLGEKKKEKFHLLLHYSSQSYQSPINIYLFKVFEPYNLDVILWLKNQ